MSVFYGLVHDKTIHIPVAEQILRLHRIPCMAHGGAVSVKPRLLGAEEEIKLTKRILLCPSFKSASTACIEASVLSQPTIYGHGFSASYRSII